MAWHFRDNNNKMHELWGQMRRSRRNALRTHFQNIDGSGCSKAPGVVKHPRTDQLHVCLCDRYLVVLKCDQNGTIIWEIRAVRSEIRHLPAAQIA